MKKEVIARCLINIIDVKHCYNYEQFLDTDLYEQLLNYGKTLYNEEIYKEYKNIIDKNKTIIKNLSNNTNYTIEDYNSFTEELRQFKRTYILKQ